MHLKVFNLFCLLHGPVKIFTEEQDVHWTCYSYRKNKVFKGYTGRTHKSLNAARIQ